MDWVPRLVRHRSAKVDQARNALEMKLGRKPTQKEIAEHLGVDGEEYKKIQRDGRPTSVVSLSRSYNQSDGNRELREIDVIKDRSQLNPLSQTQRNDLKDLITKGLSRAERLIVVLYYYEEMTMKEIGATLDLSESRVSQMHSSILARLKAQMQHREREFEAPKAG
jgi:RNA polymerase sigma factor for flagellar operon FliA